MTKPSSTPSWRASAAPCSPSTGEGTLAIAPNLTERMALMETFIRIVETGSLSAAALQLDTTQPTISRRLQALERSLGLQLLQRSTHAMKLTEDGARCFERAKTLLSDWAAFESDLRGDDAEPEGTLRVVAPHAFGQQHLIKPLASFMERYPRMTVEWLLHDRTPDFVAEGIDCAIQVGGVSDLAAVAIRIAEVPRIAVASPGLLARFGMGAIESAAARKDDTRTARPAQPNDISQLSSLPWLALQPFYRTEIMLTHAETQATHRLTFRPRMTTDSLYALRTSAILGLGACIASAWLLEADIAQGNLVRLAPQWGAPPLPVYLVYPYARFYPAKLRRFIDVMRHAMPDAMGAAIRAERRQDGK